MQQNKLTGMATVNSVNHDARFLTTGTGLISAEPTFICIYIYTQMISTCLKGDQS